MCSVPSATIANNAGNTSVATRACSAAGMLPMPKPQTSIPALRRMPPGSVIVGPAIEPTST
jgi:hypothetical protein